jgi:large subunit ribosomal protein L28
MTFCAVCYKSADIGHLVSHAKNRVRHIRKVNLHAAHITIDGVRKRVKLCSRCKRDSRQIERALLEKKAGKATLEKSSKKKAGK